jgi:hypothetical protein
MTVSVQPSAGYIRMNTELARSALIDLDAETGRFQCLAHLNEILKYLTAINSTKDVASVYILEGGELRVGLKDNIGTGEILD